MACRFVAGLVLTLGLAGASAVTDTLAQKAVTDGAAVSETFTIQAIDFKSRLVTLKDSQGHVEMVVAGPEVKRFDELKAGDTVTFRYFESVVYSIRQSGQPAPTVGEEPALVRGTGARPGGTISKQMTASVVVTAIDAAVPSVTVRRDDGATMSFKVEEKKNLTGVKVGDRVDITYTAGIAVSVESPKPKK
jgi:Cu/Ag efflux protein CusF